MNPVLHRIAQPIAVHEFIDALRAAAPPRFPHGRSIYHRRVGLAISGGVDSMALAYLCAEARCGNPSLRVADAPTQGFTAMIVNHGLREGSAEEAEQVAKVLTRMGHRAQVWPLRWPDTTATTPDGMPVPTALETNARRLRYQCLGQRLAHLKITSLLLAHHEDDQYETILMRLLSGYGLNGGIRGLRGMRAATDLPECQGIYGAHQSGFLDDQREPMPYVIMRPTRHQRRKMRSSFRAEAILDTNDNDDIDTAAAIDRQWQQWTYMHQLLGQSAPPLAPLDTEDLGIMAYRPLLPFAKDRLVATCLANNVPWFEDKTNADPTMTMRNALRYVARNHTLPKALQKPAILQLAARCDAQARQHEAEAHRLVTRYGVVVRFTPNVGTVVARLPRLQARARPRPWRRSLASTDSYGAASKEKRRLYLRTIAALVIQKLLAFVTPEAKVTPISQLQGVVDTLFADLKDPEAVKDTAAPPTDPKSFIICGVHFMPFVDKAYDTASSPESSFTRSWYLARAPYVSAATRSGNGSSSSLPAILFPALTLASRWDKQPAQWPWSSWSRWNLFDGRFWIRVRTRLPSHIVVQPFDKEHSKPFREALAGRGSSDNKSPRLSAFLATLKTYAPGKVRYTLPAIYVTSDITWALEGGRYWPDTEADEAWVVRNEQRQEVVSGEYVGEGGSYEEFFVGCDDTEYYATHPPVYQPTGDRRDNLFLWERHLRRHERAQNQKKMAEKDGGQPSEFPLGQLLALPTLGAHIPGIENWLQWEVRYRKVDKAVLESSYAAALERLYEKFRG
ncbi:hypothetical protein SEUCBS140593_002346 [Sporothrix eucalyptigena]|uniref:tRNA(Ile)-lysidine synthetase n=1 Tax=Sporothrix eucalyptigena TaxID=1812306 RepID=A0ABP0B5Q8_9PEZI